MKGKIAQPAVLRSGRTGPERSVRRVLSQHLGREVRLLRRRVPAAKTPSSFWSAWAATWRPPRLRSTTCEEAGHPGRVSQHPYCFRPFPSQAIVDALKNCTAFTVIERMDDPLSTTGNHPDARNQSGLLRCGRRGQNGDRKDRPPAAQHLQPRRPGEPRRPSRRHHRHLRQHDQRRAGLFLRRHSSPVWHGDERPDLHPTGEFSMGAFGPAEFGSVTTEQGHRHDRRPGVRQRRCRRIPNTARKRRVYRPLTI